MVSFYCLLIVSVYLLLTLPRTTHSLKYDQVLDKPWVPLFFFFPLEYKPSGLLCYLPPVCTSVLLGLSFTMLLRITSASSVIVTGFPVSCFLVSLFLCFSFWWSTSSNIFLQKKGMGDERQYSFSQFFIFWVFGNLCSTHKPDWKFV